MKSLSELMNLKGKVALITGGAGHLGQTFAETLAELSADLVLMDINIERCRAVGKRITEQYDVTVDCIEADLEQDLIFPVIAESIKNKFGRLDILINNAAFVGTSQLDGWATTFDKQSLSVWRRALDVNLTAAFALVQACHNLLKLAGKGVVINIGSIYGMLGPNMRFYEGTHLGNPAAYSASKGGLLQLTRWLATTLAPEIRVNAISPGGIERGQPDIFQQRYCESTPLQRMGVEEDLKGAIAFLASDLSQYVNGQNIMVDGGLSAW